MPKIFDKMGFRSPKMSAFDLSREQKLTFNIGQLIPTFLEEVLPSDQFRVRTESLVRFPALLAPIMHKIDCYMHYFYVPNRLVWEEWEDFITGGKDGNLNPNMPMMAPGLNREHGTLADYLGLPTTKSGVAHDPDISVSALPFRAYQLIYNEYYRDPNLHNDLKEDILTSIDDSDLNVVRNRCWEKDYFTSALPWTQRGPQVGVDGSIQYKDQSTLHDTTGEIYSISDDLESDQSGGLRGKINNVDLQLQNLEKVGIDINELRKSTALQKWLEKSARGGYRYIEQIMAHFGIKSDDARLQRPEYLGGGKQPIIVSEVLNTSNTEEHPQGDMTGHAISAGQTNSFSHRFKDHGYVMGIMSILPKASYSQGIPRHFFRTDRYDYYWPDFANLGEQEIKRKELNYVDGLPPEAHDDAFGYQQRYAEYKHGKSTVHGDFKEDLDFWHLSRKFDYMQTSLTPSFVTADPEQFQRIFPSQDSKQVLAQLYHKVQARRPMPYHSDPRLT